MIAGTLLLAAAVLTRPLPNSALTPGVTRPLTKAQVCATKWGKDRRHVTLAMRKQTFATYGIPYAQHALYEVDHIVPRELGGADDVRNLWPQKWTGEWNARMKDRLENNLHVRVCAGTLSLVTAQHAIATDWIAAFQLFVDGHPR